MSIPKGKSAELKSIYSDVHALMIDTQYAHDMSIHTQATDIEKNDFSSGKLVRIYSYYGSRLFADLNEQLNKTLLDDFDFNKFDTLIAPEIDLTAMGKISLIDHIADQSVLNIYKNETGLIGLNTGYSKFDMWDGPIVWICGDKENDTTPALQKRREIFEPIFDLTKYVADRFNRSPEVM